MYNITLMWDETGITLIGLYRAFINAKGVTISGMPQSSEITITIDITLWVHYLQEIAKKAMIENPSAFSNEIYD